MTNEGLAGYTSRANLCADGFRDEFLVELFGPPTSIDGIDYWSAEHVDLVERTVIAPAVLTAYRVDAQRLYGDHTRSHRAVLDGAKKFVQSWRSG